VTQESQLPSQNKPLQLPQQQQQQQQQQQHQQHQQQHQQHQRHFFILFLLQAHDYYYLQQEGSSCWVLGSAIFADTPFLAILIDVQHWRGQASVWCVAQIYCCLEQEGAQQSLESAHGTLETRCLKGCREKHNCYQRTQEEKRTCWLLHRQAERGSWCKSHLQCCSA